jgi:hypothetical protein
MKPTRWCELILILIVEENRLPVILKKSVRV